MKTRKHLLTILTAAMLAAATTTPPATAAFRYTKIAELSFDPLTGQQIDPATGLPTLIQLGGLNNRGQVAYSKLQWNQDAFSEFVATVQIADSCGARQVAGPFASEEGFIELATVTGLTDNGRVGFGLQKFDLETADPVASRFLVSFRGQANAIMDGTAYGLVNESGTVAFDTVDQGVFSIFTGRRAPFRHVATDPDILWDIGPVAVYGFPGIALNEAGAVAYYKSSTGANGADSGLYLWSNGATKRVFDPRTHGLPNEFTGEATRADVYLQRGFALNNQGAVAVQAWQPIILDFGWMVYTGAWPSRIVRVVDGLVTTLATADGPEVFPDDSQWFYGPFGLNDSGYATWMWTGRGQTALYVGDGAHTSRVVGLGDVLDGKGVTWISEVASGYLNERGQVALTIFFDDNSMAIILATPQKDP